MAVFIIYSIRWAVTLVLLYSLYRLLLRRETFHRLNRAVLLAILIASPLLPLIPLHIDEPTTINEVLTRIETPLMNISTGNTEGSTPAMQEDKNVTTDLWVRYCAYFYIIGIVVSFAIYVFRLLSLFRLLLRCKRISHPMVPNNVHLMLGMGIKQPSSWMRWIIIGPIDLKQNAEPVIKHELAHVRLGHSWDVILCDLTCSLLWCLPFAWMLRQDLVDVHEFQADEAVLQGGVKLENYEHLLVRKAIQAQYLPIMNTLRRGAVKKRFAMMHSGRSSSWSRLKLLYLLPALVASLWVSAKTEEYQVYINGKLAIREKIEKLDSATIKHVTVNHPQKKIFIETISEQIDTGEQISGVRPEDVYFEEVEQMPQFPGGDAAAKTEEYQVYINGKLAIREKIEKLDSATIKHVTVNHPQKKIFIETISEQIDTGEQISGVRPEDVYFEEVEQMPQFPGGDAAFKQYMAHHIRFPKAAVESGIDGTFKVQFIVETDGRITNVQAINTTSRDSDVVVNKYGTSDQHPSLEEYEEGQRALRESAEELFRSMPPYEPGLHHGKPVRVKMTRTINYSSK